MRRAVEAEEDAEKLKLGPDFESAKCLLNSEVHLVLEHKMKASQGQQQKSNFLKTHEYVSRTDKFKSVDMVTQVRGDLEKKGLHYFEVAQLGNLLPETTEEAKALIPSLTESKISTEQLSELLDELGAYRKFHA